MHFLPTLFLAALLPTAHVQEIPPDSQVGGTISVSEAAARRKKSGGARIFFRLEGRVASTYGNSFILRDGSGSVSVMVSCDDKWSPGDTIRTVCTFLPKVPFDPLFIAEALSIEVLRHGTPDIPVSVPLPDLAKGGHDLQPVTVEGVVTDAFRDEVAPDWNILILESDGASVAIYFSDKNMDQGRLNAMIDAGIHAEGIYFPAYSGARRYLTSTIQTASRDSIHIVKPPPADPFSAKRMQIDKITTFEAHPHRRRISGSVVAAWGGKAFFMRTDDGMRIEVHLNRNGTPPPVGSQVTAVGFVRKNIFYPYLSNAIVRTDKGPQSEPEEPIATTPQRILFDENGERNIQHRINGRIVSMEGAVRDILIAGNEGCRVILNCEGITVPVLLDAEIAPPAIGSEIRVAGACRITMETADGNYGLPRLNGLSVIPRNAADITVLRHPPWWTAGRLLMVIGALVVIIAGILAWNISLRILAERRGRKLFRAQAARLQANLKVEERTRLAVELHDSLSQTLTGIALLLDSATRANEGGRPIVDRFLDTVRQMLASCRRELQGCLWDLRSRTFEEKDMDEAVMRTISPNVGDAKVRCRFDVPRRLLSETTTHAVLRIVRELVVNAVNHGGATDVRIDGAYKDGCLQFSVSDNGGGFDVDSAAGPAQGHFGLQGVRERINDFNGSLKIESAPGKGAKVSVKMDVSGKENDGKQAQGSAG